MRIDILTLFPQMFAPLFDSILGRAQQAGVLDVNVHNIRDYTLDKHRRTDDYPFGGGAGLVMTAQPIVDAMQAVQAMDERPARRIYLSPSGRQLDVPQCKALAQAQRLILLCGHYEGVDQRALDLCIDEEVSIGDYVLTGGELPAMVLVDAVSRFVPGVLGSSLSGEEESFMDSLDGMLEYPQYTRPADFRGLGVPEVLLNGNHAHIRAWRQQQSLLKTRLVRPDLLKDEQ